MIRLSRALQMDVSVGLLFDKPTLAALCEGVDQLRSARRGLERPPLTRAPRDEPLPLSFFQERIWEFCRTAPDPLLFTTHVDIDLSGPLNVVALERSLTELFRRHEVLRTSFGVRTGQPVQIVGAAQAVPLPLVDLTRDPDPATAADRLSVE